MGKIVLVTGGARSGKSRFAEQYAARFGKKVAYIATAGVYDEEMAFRVKLHRERRPKNWHTWEAPENAHLAIEEAGKAHDMILFDCLTLYISNLLCALENVRDSAANYELIREKISLLLEAAKEQEGTTIFVTNEVGAGIVPENHLAREYRDITGIANQLTARAADEVYVVSCGIAVDFKKLAVSWQTIRTNVHFVDIVRRP